MALLEKRRTGKDVRSFSPSLSLPLFESSPSETAHVFEDGNEKCRATIFVNLPDCVG